MGLDRIDREIVAALQNNARLSNKELAAAVGLAPSSCLERVRKLQDGGVLRGYHAEVDPAALGVELEVEVGTGPVGEGGVVADRARKQSAIEEAIGLPVLDDHVPAVLAVALEGESLELGVQAGLGRAGREENCVVVVREFFRVYILADIGVGDELDAFFAKEVDATFDNVFIEFHIWDAIHE